MRECGMDRERAEVYLRQLAEAEFRRVLLRAEGPRTWRVRAVANALTTVGALDRGTAEAVQKDLQMAVAARESDRHPFRVPVFRRLVPPTVTSVPKQPPGTTRLAYSSTLMISKVAVIKRPSPGQAPPRTAPDLIVPLGLRIPLESEDLSGELHLITFAQTASGARVIMRARILDAPDPPLMPAGRAGPRYRLLKDLAMTDEAGRVYQLRFAGSSDQHGFIGYLDVSPPLPPGVRWVEISHSGGPATRASLERPDPGTEAAAITVISTENTAAELLLNDYAMRMLTYDDDVPESAVVLGDVVAALLEAGALSPASPVPGRLARLCERLGGGDHGITASPARDDELPDQWRSEPRQPSIPFPPDQCAACAVVLPELDGITMTLFGLINTDQVTLLYLRATGVTDSRHEAPALWIRDDLGGWHGTRRRGWHARDDEAEVRLEIWPPLNHCSAIEVAVAGRSAEVRATIPLRWR
jgi:hypothetical protein